MDELLQSLGYSYKYADLTPEEKRTVDQWLQDLQVRRIEVEDIKGYIYNMKCAVEDELCKPGVEKEAETMLKARLRNYMLLEAFLTAPDRAKKVYESQLKNMKKTA